MQTVWSTVLKARGTEGPEGHAALDRLLTRYRQPIYRCIRASLPSDNRSIDLAEDLTQGFLYQCLRRDFLKDVGPEHGRFRTFIKACIKNFLRDQHDRETAKKRGEGVVPFSLDETNEEGNRVRDAVSPTQSVVEVLDREWAMSVLDRAMENLARECIMARRGELFEALKAHLGRAPEPGPAKEIGARLRLSEGAVNTAMSRLRARLGELVRAEVRETVSGETEVQEELRYLIELLGR